MQKFGYFADICYTFLALVPAFIPCAIDSDIR